jgi:hypothetical protein
VSRESDTIVALRTRLAQADSAFELSRCHFEAHALLRKFPGSVEGRLLLEQIERAMRSQGTEEGPPPRPEPRTIWRSALRPLPWAVGLVVLAYVALHLLRRLFK